MRSMHGAPASRLLRTGVLAAATAACCLQPFTTSQVVSAAGCYIPLSVHQDSPKVHDRKNGSDYAVRYELASNAQQRPDGCYRDYDLQINPQVQDYGPRPIFSNHYHIRIWVCGQRRPDLDVDFSESYDFNHEQPPGQRGFAQTPWINYGPGCGVQADDVGSDSYSDYWTPAHAYALAHMP